MNTISYSWLTEETLRDGDLTSLNELLDQLSPKRAHSLTEQELYQALEMPLMRIRIARNSKHKIIGFGSLSMLRCLSFGLNAMIDDLVVDEEFRNHGIGRAILYGLEKHGKSQGAVIASLVTSVPDAKRLYKRLDYHSLGSDFMGKWLNWDERFRERSE